MESAEFAPAADHTPLMIVGIVGLLISLLWMTIWADRRRGAAVIEDTAVSGRVYR